MNDIQMQIKALSAQAALLSQKAVDAFKHQDFVQGKQLMVEAVAASKDCQRLIQEYMQQVKAN